MTATVKRGQIWYADLSPVRGSEQGGLRPVVIVQNDIGNKYAPTVIAIPLTTQTKNDLPTHATVMTNSTALCEQVKTLDKSRLKKCIGECTIVEMAAIDKALKISLNLTF